MDKKVTIYSTPACPYCKRAKAYLQEKGVEYTDLDVSQDESARNEMLKKSGAMSVPVIDINGALIIGFDKEKIDRELAAQ